MKCGSVKSTISEKIDISTDDISVSLGLTNDLNNWSFRSETTRNCFSNISYNTSTHMNDITVTGVGGEWEVVYLPIATTAGHTYTFTCDLKNTTGYNALNSSYGGIGIEAIKTTPVNSDNLSNSIETTYLPTAQSSSITTHTLTFTATNARTYIAFNFGMSADGGQLSALLGNFKLTSLGPTNNLTHWNNTAPSCFSTTYNSWNKLSTLVFKGVGVWEIVYMPINTVPGKTYTFTCDFQNITGYSALNSSYGGIGMQALQRIENSNGLTDNALATTYLPTAQNSSITTHTLTFTATGTTTYIGYNFGMTVDGTQYSVAIGNFKLSDVEETWSYICDGNARTVATTVIDTSRNITLIEGTDYSVSYSNNTNVGTATATITGIGDYTNSRTANFTICATGEYGTAISSSYSNLYAGTDSSRALVQKSGTSDDYYNGNYNRPIGLTTIFEQNLASSTPTNTVKSGVNTISGLNITNNWVEVIVKLRLWYYANCS